MLYSSFTLEVTRVFITPRGQQINKTWHYRLVYELFQEAISVFSPPIRMCYTCKVSEYAKYLPPEANSLFSTKSRLLQLLLINTLWWRQSMLLVFCLFRLFQRKRRPHQPAYPKGIKLYQQRNIKYQLDGKFKICDDYDNYWHLVFKTVTKNDKNTQVLAHKPPSIISDRPLLSQKTEARMA